MRCHALLSGPASIPKRKLKSLSNFSRMRPLISSSREILLIRFLEDHGFFDKQGPDGVVHRRYLCNGGVAAFQGMHDYFGHGYTRLLEEAYRTGGHFYSAAFDETELDWIIALSVPELSRTLEWAMFRFARFDFASARGDLLTSVYDQSP